MSTQRLSLLILFSLTVFFAPAQDSILTNLQQIPQKYISQVDTKIDKYYSRITNKTEKTLARLAKWENKIKQLLEKASPETAKRLFADNQTTFTSLLEKYKEGKAVTEGYRKQYDEYRDKLNSSFAYLEKQKEVLDTKLIKPIKQTKEKLQQLDSQEENTDAVQQFIKQRKKQLLDQSIQYLGKSKYLAKINKDSYYYLETLKNYKEIFQDKKKAEQTALTILNKIPAFQNFFKQNSMLAALFNIPGAQGAGLSNLAGLQTRASVNTLIQQRVAAGGPNAQQQIMQNIQAAQQQLQQLKDKIIKAGGNSSDANLPDFKPNQEKSKTLLQRIKLGTDLGFIKNNALMPTTMNLGITVSYKFSQNKEMGIGMAYKAGLGSINHIQITHQGLGLRSFASMKFKKNFWFTGGWEANHNAGFKNIAQLREYNSWQQSALVGFEKRLNIKTKWFKGSKVSFLWDMLARQHVPVSQPVVFRMGYNF